LYYEIITGWRYCQKEPRHAKRAEETKEGIRKQVSGSRIQVTGEVTVFTAELQLTKNPLTSQKVQIRAGKGTSQIAKCKSQNANWRNIALPGTRNETSLPSLYSGSSAREASLPASSYHSKLNGILSIRSSF
jgi:hypothetical protein